MKGKKGVVISQVLFGALAVLLIFVMVSGYNIYRREGIKGINQISNIFGNTSFVPYKPIYTDEEQIVLNSMKALIDSINSLAKREYLNSYGNERIDEDPGFSKYRITWSGDMELEERDGILGICIATGCNSHRQWSFSKEFDAIIGNPTQQEDWVWADYYYGECSNPGSNQWTNKGYCNEIDDASVDYRNGRIRADIDSNLAAVRDILPVYNIKLETLDASGNVLCTATTADSNNIRGLVDTSKDEFITWGAVADWEKTCGSDNDGDGIKGQYCEDDYGKPWREVVPEERHQDVLNSGKVQRYFSEGVVKDSMDNGENCLDSPTWLECNGIRIYYCGKTGYKSGANDERDYYYFGSDDDLHSRSGTKYLRVIDPEKFTREGPSSEFRNTMGDITDDRNQIQVRDPDWNNPLQWSRGAWDYARDYDLDIVLGIGLGTIVWPWGGIVGGGIAIATKESEDPRVFCYGGKNYSGSNVVAKCDPELGACGVCDFELPQDVSDVYNDNMWHMAGYGDPKYVIYYESFPVGEEEAWRLDPLQIDMMSILMWDAGANLIPFAGSLAKSIRQSENVAAFFSRIAKFPPIALIKATVNFGTAPIRFVGRLTREGIERVGGKIDDVVRTFIRNQNKEAFIKMFSDSESIIKYVTDWDAVGKAAESHGLLEMIDASDEVAEWLLKNDDEMLSLAEQFIKNNPDLVSHLDVIKARLGPQLARKSLKHTLGLTFAMSMAKQDSMNQKFEPLGVNEIGMKKPYLMSVKTGEGALSGKDLVPEVEKYYLQLVKDKYRGGVVTGLLKDQSGERFFLASPCHTNLQIVESKCSCWDIDDEGVEITDHFGSPVHVLKVSVNDNYPESDPRRYDSAIKVCRDRSAGLTSLTLDKPVYQTDCILVNPVAPSGNWEDGNFCYSGSHTIEDIAKLGVLVGQIGASVALNVVFDSVEVLGSPTVLVTAAAYGLNTLGDILIDVAAAAAINELSKETKWPNH